MTAPVASGWSDCRAGFAPAGKRRLCTAHATSSRSRAAALEQPKSHTLILSAGSNWSPTGGSRCRAGGGWSGGGRPDVLVHAEEVLRVVLCLDGRETGVVFAVARLHAALRFVVHHEVDVG